MKRLSDALSISRVSETHTADSSDQSSLTSGLITSLLERTYLNLPESHLLLSLGLG